MNRLTIRSLRACAAASAAMLTVPSVLAQEMAPAGVSPGGALEEVTVTARRREESLQDVPIAVTAFSAEDLSLHGTVNIGELTDSVPSVTLEPTRATNSTLTAFIRGVGQQDPLAGFEQGVALYVDDVYIARPQGSLLDIYDIERVEVLRGPQGTLYGRNAVGGAIKYVTRPLSEDAGFSVRANYGSYNQIDLVGTASLPLGDTFRVGAALASLTRDGYGDNRTTGAEHYDKDVLAYRVSAEFEPNDAWLVRLAYDHTDDKSNAVAGYRPFAGALSGAPVLDDLRDTEAGATGQPSTAGIGGNNELEAEGIHGTIQWTVSDSLTLRSITAYREDYTESVIDFDSLPVMDFDGAVIYDNEQFSQEFQLLYSGERWTAVAGVYYLDATASNDFDIVLGQLIPGVPLTSFTGGAIDTEAWSLFADVTYDLTDRWALSVGARYTEDKRTADVFRANYIGIGSPFFGNTSAPLFNVTSDYEAERTYDDVSPRVNLSYAPSDDVTLYAGYSQGFKAGSFDPRGANLVTPEVEQGFDPETLDSFEAGLKATWLDGRARTNVALFYSDYQDMQIPGSLAIDTDGDGVNDDFIGAVTNAGQAVIQGIEVEGEFLLTDRLSLQLALSALDTEIEEWIVEGVDVSDEREVQNTPETMAYLGLTHRTDFDAGTLNLNVNGSYKSEIVQFEVPVPVIDQDSYTLLNASVVWVAGGGHWSLGLHGKNLTDEDVKTAGYCFGSGGCPTTLGLEDNTTVFYGPPRTLTASFEYRF